jgi:carbon monoxide dehydrogenase subunit G
MNITQEIMHSFDVTAPRELVWSFLWDPQALARCLQGCEDVVVVEEGKSYRVRVRRKVSVFVVGLELDITVLEREAGRYVRLEISGKDTRLRSELHLALLVSVDEIAPNECRINLGATINLSGLLAALKKTLVSMQISQTLDDFATRLRSGIEEQASCLMVNPSPEKL